MAKINGRYVSTGYDVVNAIGGIGLLGTVLAVDLESVIDTLCEQAENEGRDQGYQDGYESASESEYDYAVESARDFAIGAVEAQIDRLRYGGLDLDLTPIEVLERVLDTINSER